MDTTAGIAVITLLTEDLAASKAFYSTVLGASTEFEDADSAVFRVGGTLINLLRAEQGPELLDPAPMGDPAAGVRAVYTVEVDDVDAEAERLATLGIPLLNGPMDRPWGIRTLSVRDPAGHVWELAN